MNGYKKSTIQKLWKKHRKKQSLEEITTLQNYLYLVLPYVPEFKLGYLLGN